MSELQVFRVDPPCPQVLSRAAYEAGPLAQDLFARVWAIAQAGEQPYRGG